MTKENENLNIISTKTPIREFTASNSGTANTKEKGEIIDITDEERFLNKLDLVIKQNTYLENWKQEAKVEEEPFFTSRVIENSLGVLSEMFLKITTRDTLSPFGKYFFERTLKLEGIIRKAEKLSSLEMGKNFNSLKDFIIDMTKEKNEQIARLERKIEQVEKEGKNAINQFKLQQENKNKEKEQKQRALQSKEKVEYEAIKEKYEKLEVTASTEKEKLELQENKVKELLWLFNQKEQEAEIFFLEYERLEAGWKVLVLEKAHLEVELADQKNLLDDTIRSKDREIKRWENSLEIEVNENKERRQKITSLENQINTLEDGKRELELEIKKQIQQKRLGNLFAAGVFITDYLPIPEKWQTSIKTGFNTAQAWQIATDIPQATYEVIIGFTAILVFLGAKGIWHRIFGRKEINKIAELRGELTDALRQKNKLETEIKELKEPKITPQILPEKTEEIFNANSETQNKKIKVKRAKKNKEKK